MKKNKKLKKKLNDCEAKELNMAEQSIHWEDDE